MKTVVSRSFIVAGLVGAGVLPLSSEGCSSSDNTTGSDAAGGSSSGGSSGSGSSSGSSGGSSSSSSGGSSSGSSSGSHDAGEAGAPPINCTFDTATPECTAPANGVWKLNNYVDPLNLAAPPPVSDAGSGTSDAAEAGSGNEAGSAGDAGSAGEAGTVADAGTSVGPTITVNTMDGNPSPGSLQLTATFTNYNQFVEAILPITPFADLTSRVLTANIRLASVTGAAAFPGGAVLYTSTAGSAYCYTPGGSIATLPVGTWTPVTEDLSTATGSNGCTADPSMVPQIGLHFYANAATAEAGAFPGPITAVFEIDTVVAQ
jgi:hypothetical protein